MPRSRFLCVLWCAVSLLSSLAPSSAEDAGEANRSTVEPPAIAVPKPAEEVRESDAREAMCLMMESAAKASNLPLEFFARVIWQESRFRSDAIGPVTRSGQRAQGIAQFMPGTAAAYGLDDPFDADHAIDAQAHLMRDLLRSFGSVPLALAAYNAGSARVRACGCIPAIPETQAYVANILGLLNGAGDPNGAGADALEIRLVK
jgi:soluble lytic murein transglycosylase-like protein